MLVIVGSSDLWVTPEISAMVLSRILATDPYTSLGVRVPRGSEDPTSMLEQFVARLAPDLGRVVARCRATSNKKGDVFRRDYEMVQTAVSVMAFFAPDQEMEGGTGHVVQAALARNIPVEAYKMNDQGYPELLGSDDGGFNGIVDSFSRTVNFTGSFTGNHAIFTSGSYQWDPITTTASGTSLAGFKSTPLYWPDAANPNSTGNPRKP